MTIGYGSSLNGNVVSTVGDVVPRTAVVLLDGGDTVLNITL
jgi:hypothetical protein